MNSDFKDEKNSVGDVPKNRKEQGIQVLSRAANILRALKDNNEGLSLGKIALRVGLPRSTVQRIVNTLITEGMMSAGHGSAGFCVGPEIFALAQAGQSDVSKALHPIMVELSEETGETVDLAQFRNHCMVFIDQVVGAHRLRAVSAIGERFPMSCTSNGKAVLACMDGPTIQKIIAMESKEGLFKKTKQQLLSEIAEIRRVGYALDNDEHTMGISAVGISFTASNFVYALSVPAPTHRFNARLTTIINKLQIAKNKIHEVIPDSL